MIDILHSITLLLVLLNPFLIIVYLIDIAGRVIALLLGTVSIELIMSGLDFRIKQKF